MILVDRHGPVTDRPDWVSLEVLVDVQLDDGTSVSPSEAPYMRGGPLDCSRRELEESVRSLIFSEPRYLPDDPRAEPPKLVSELRPHGIETTLEVLAALPLAVTVSEEVEALREKAAPT